MSKYPLVSVIIPVYNGGVYLQDAINSIMHQTYKNIEIIIINDGSNDGSKEVLDCMKKSDSRIKLFHRENSGIVETLNFGLTVSTGEYIARMDADDVAHPTRIEKQLAKLHHENLILCGSQVEFIGSRSGISVLPTAALHCKIQSLFSTPVFHPTVMFKKVEVKYDRGLQDAEDYKLWVDLLELGNVENINEPLLKYRVHKNQVSRKYNINQIYNQLRISDYAIAKYLNTSDSHSYLQNISILVEKAEFSSSREIKEIVERNLFYLMAFFGLNGVRIYLNFVRKHRMLNNFRFLKLVLRTMKWRKFKYEDRS